MGAATENFCLRWNDFESNVSGAFRELRAESDFFDVTLTCDDAGARTMQAHKVILSACSSAFKQMLRSQSGNPSPLIYLRGVRMTDLESVLDFMYHGEVNVAQEDLNSFLGVAEDLQVRGLTQGTAAAASSSSSASRRVGGKKSSAGPAPSSAPSAKRIRKQTARAAAAAAAAEEEEEDEDDEDIKEIKNEPMLEGGGASTSAAGQAVTDPDFQDPNYADESYVDATEAGAGDYGYAGQLDAAAAGASAGGAAAGMEQDSTKANNASTDFNALVEGLMTYENGVHTCNLCGKKSPWRTTMVRHVESNHVETAGHVCDVCGVVSKTRHAFAMHKKRKHTDGMPTNPAAVAEAAKKKQQQEEQDEKSVILS